MQRKRIEENLKNISSSSKALPTWEDTVKNLVGNKLGRGQFGTVSVYTPDSSKIIRETYGFGYVSKNLKDDYEDSMEQVEKLVEDIQCEPFNIQYFSSLKSKFPHNIIELHNHFACRRNNYYQNNYIMDRVHGLTLYEFAYGLDMINFHDVCTLFIQAYYISVYTNTHGIFHNDLKMDNMMVSNDRKNITLAGLVLGDNIIKIEFEDTLALKLIDYGFTRKIKKTQVVPIETIPIIEIFSEILKIAKTSEKNFLRDFDIFACDLIKLGLPSWNKKCINMSPYSLYNDVRQLNDVDITAILKALSNFSTVTHKINIIIDKMNKNV